MQYFYYAVRELELIREHKRSEILFQCIYYCVWSGFFFFFCPVVYFLFKLDLEAFFASGKDFFFFLSPGTSLFKSDLEAFFASGKGFYSRIQR